MRTTFPGWLVALAIIGVVALYYVTEFSPSAKECNARGGRWYPASGNCGVFVFETR